MAGTPILGSWGTRFRQRVLKLPKSFAQRDEEMKGQVASTSTVATSFCVSQLLCVYVMFVLASRVSRSLAWERKPKKKKKKTGFLHRTPLTSWKRMMMILTLLRIGTMMLTTTMASRETIAMCRRISRCASWACNYYISRLINFLIFFTHICAFDQIKGCLLLQDGNN